MGRITRQLHALNFGSLIYSRPNYPHKDGRHLPTGANTEPNMGKAESREINPQGSPRRRYSASHTHRYTRFGSVVPMKNQPYPRRPGA